jgi:hypothetical protein
MVGLNLKLDCLLMQMIYHLKTPQWCQDKLNLEKNMDQNWNKNLHCCML